MEYQPSSVYNQLNSLQNLKGLSQKNPDKALEQVAKEFESLFTHMLLKSMRAANEVFKQGNYFNSNETQFFEEMLDNQLSIELSKGKGIGLADMLMKQLSPIVNGASHTKTVSGIPQSNRGLEELSAIQKNTIPFDKAIKQRQLPYTLRYVQAFKSPSSAEKEVADSQPVPGEKALSPLYNAVTTVAAKISGGQSDNQSNNNQPDDIASLLKPLNKVLTHIEKVTSDPKQFTNPESFIRHVYPIAKKLTSPLGFNPAVLVAQAALETGWGKHIIKHGSGDSSYNLFGIKADRRWQGDKANVNTLEYRQGVAVKERADFRSYNSIADSINDYVDFLKVNPRYQIALTKRSNPEQFLNALQQAGYATDPKYANKILRITNGELFKETIAKL